MKLRHFLLLILFSLLAGAASACNFTLAEDVTPPPGYVPPTPAPTLVLVPPQTPNVENGKAIYAEKCAGCHGATGLGDGPQGIQLEGVTVPAFGLPELARSAVLADWYTTVTRGRMDRFMPPFASLTDQQRWDVVAYAMTLHASPDQITKGKQLFEANCANCSTDFFKNESKIFKLSEVDLARMVRQGNESLPGFGASLSEDDVWAVAAYLRTLAFDTTVAVAQAPTPTAQPATQAPVVSSPSGSETAVAAQAGTPTGEGTAVGTEPVAATNEPTIVARPGFGTITGAVENNTGADLPSNLKVTLRGYEHGNDPNAGPQEIITLQGALNADGTYKFENVEMPENRIFVSEVVVEGITLKSAYGIVQAGTSALALPPITVYGMTNDTSALVMDEVRIFLEYGDTDVRVYGVYSFRNPSDKTILVELKDGTEIPFIKNPEGTTPQGYEGLQDSEPFVSTDKGLAIPPSDKSYGLISFTSVPKAKKFDLAQPFVLPVLNLTVFLPEGVKAEGSALTDEGMQTIQNFNFDVYTALNVPAGATIKFTVTGEPKESAATATSASATSNTTRKNILYGAGALGVALILAGGWLFLRDRRRAEEEVVEEEREFESSDDVLDAIVALDDLHRARKISDEAYHKRRAELKELLKGMM